MAFCLVVKEHGFLLFTSASATSDHTELPRLLQAIIPLSNQALWPGVGFPDIFFSFSLGSIEVNLGIDRLLVLGKSALPLMSKLKGKGDAGPSFGR